MRAAVIIAVAVSLLLAATGPALGRRLPPAVATRLLVAAAVLVAGCSVFVVLCWIIARVVGTGHGGYVAAALGFGGGATILTAHATGISIPVAGAVCDALVGSPTSW